MTGVARSPRHGYGWRRWADTWRGARRRRRCCSPSEPCPRPSATMYAWSSPTRRRVRSTRSGRTSGASRIPWPAMSSLPGHFRRAGAPRVSDPPRALPRRAHVSDSAEMLHAWR
ncbi:hypothetical protein E6R18_17705 [Streptomyces sp. A1277]|nr:hypothetical protein E6R18_17705 [Streptomyces sp. A1277]